MSDAGEAAAATPAEGSHAAVLRWSAHPLVQEPWPKSLALGLVIAASAVAAAVGLEGFFYGALALLVLCASMSSYLVPTRCELNASGIVISNLLWRRQRRWSEIRRLDVHRDGFFLSPFAAPHRLDSYRGLFVPCGNCAPSHLAEIVRRHVPN